MGNARVGQRTDYDKLTMEIWTDGSIKPEDAVAYGAKILKEQMNIFINFEEGRSPRSPRSRTRATSRDTTRTCCAASMSLSFRFAAPTA